MSRQSGDLLPWPDDELSAYGSVESRPVGRMQGVVARVMERNWVRIPHVTHHDDADITDFEARRRDWNLHHPDQKRSLLAALVKASVAALMRYPQLNVALSADGSRLTQRQYFHIGIAVDVPDGLLVPVLRNCDRKTIDEITGEIAKVSEKARGRGLSIAEMSGGCFTLSSLGHIGGSGFTPIINAPEVAILGICRTKDRFLPANDGTPVLRHLLPLSLSYDHRVVNGVIAARFMRAIADSLLEYQFE